MFHAAMPLPQVTKQHEDILGIFFRALMVSCPAVHNSAMTALERFIRVSKIPKNLLQNSLRPILQNLGNYKSLSLKLLKGLGRLLQLLSDWFNITLGEKLIEHLRNWLEPDKLMSGSFEWNAGQDAGDGRGRR